jgi:hypothetical protein
MSLGEGEVTGESFFLANENGYIKMAQHCKKPIHTWLEIDNTAT